MKKIILSIIVSLFASSVFAADPVAYDSAAVKEVMKSNMGLVGSITKAIGASDWVAVADGFIQFSNNAKKVLTFKPPKGDIAEWQKIWNDFLFAAYQGVGAAGNKDATAAKKALDQITGDRNQGHPKFK